MFVKCSSLTHCVVALPSKSEMMQFLNDRTASLNKELSQLEQPSLFSLPRVDEIKAELALIKEIKHEISTLRRV